MEKNIQKVVLIGVLTVISVFVGLFINNLVDERAELSEETQMEIAEAWSGNQCFAGPVLCVPVCEGESPKPVAFTYITPDKQDVDAAIKSETLHRGIFDTSVFHTAVTTQGTYNTQNVAPSAAADGRRLDWSRVQVIAGINDCRSIEEGMQMTLNNKKIELDTQFSNYGNDKLASTFPDLFSVCGIVDLSGMVGSELQFSLSANLKGAGEMDIRPMARDSKITIHGNCTEPSFTGTSLPTSREINAEGFAATWKVHNLNRPSSEQTVAKADAETQLDTVGTKLLIRGGQYTQTDRALKYAFLVVLLSLLAVFVGEMSVKSSINALNYLLIGAALVIFYLLLLSIAEWTGFDVAYAISAVLVLGMIATYLKAIVKSTKTVAAVILFMALIDVFIYVLLSIADMALLLGTIGLFIILGVAMFFSLRLGKLDFVLDAPKKSPNATKAEAPTENVLTEEASQQDAAATPALAEPIDAK